MEAIVIPISAIEHFVYCPRQCALIHCDGVWADNVYTVRWVPCSPPSRLGQGSPRAWQARSARDTLVVGEVGSYRPGGCGRVGWGCRSPG